MNILPHKSWHVRNRVNIERVRRDEAKAEEEEKERQKRIALAEQEARTDLLRQRARKTIKDTPDIETNDVKSVEPGLDGSESGKSSDIGIYTADSLATDIYSGEGGHINFFKAAEQGVKEEKHNKEHESEKKAEKEKWEKSVGILTYLGQSASKEQGSTDPWYTKPSKRKRKEEDDEDEINVKEKKRKHSMDPIHDMNKYLDKKKHKHKDNEKHKHSKHKHKKKDKQEKRHSKEIVPTTSKPIEQLRAERLKRELEERQKTAALMAKLRGEKSPEEAAEKVEVSDRDRKYNSQYNPDFIRKPKQKHRDNY